MKMILKVKRERIDPNFIVGKLYVDDKYYCDTLELKIDKIYQKYQMPYDQHMEPLHTFGKPNKKENYFLKEGEYDIRFSKNLSYYNGVEFYDILYKGLPIIDGARQGSLEYCIKVNDAKSNLYHIGIMIGKLTKTKVFRPSFKPNNRELYVKLYDDMVQADSVKFIIS